MTIRLGTFNLYQFAAPPYSWYTKKDRFNARQWNEKTTWIKEQLRLMDCDIIGFQEVFSADELEALVKELGFAYFVTADTAKLSTNNPQKYVTTTVALASKYPITKVQKVRAHTPTIRAHDFQGHFTFSRLPIKATISLPHAQELLVYVCHLKSNRLNEYEYVFNAEHTLDHKKEVVTKALENNASPALRKRLCEASSLFYDIRKSKDKAVAILCDLNDKEYSLTIDALSNHKYHDSNRKEHYILHDAYSQHTPIVHNPHPEAKAPSRKPTSYFLGKGNVLDYIFISDAYMTQSEVCIAKVTDYRVLDAHIAQNKDGSLLTSDHAQVVCELTYDKVDTHA